MEKGFKLNTNAIKIIALICMIIDHIPRIFPLGRKVYIDFPFSIFHFIGRISAPLFFYLLAFGFKHTRNRLKYALRLLAFALISYFPHIIYFEEMPTFLDPSSWLHFNVFFMLFLGAVLLAAIDVRPILQNKALDNCIKTLMIIGVLMCASYVEFQYFGIILICVFYFTMDNKIKMSVMAAVVMAADFLFAIISSIETQRGLRFFDAIYYAFTNKYPINFMLMSSGVFLAIPFLLLKDKNDCKRPSKFLKYFFYVFYPLHLSIFVLLNRMLEGR